VFACVTCLGHGRRVQASGAQWGSSPSAENKGDLQWHGDMTAVNSLEALATLLKELHPTAAFSPVAPFVAHRHVPLNARMAGFGGAAPPPKKKEAEPKKQWTRFTKMVKSGAANYTVSARIVGESEWTPVGFMSLSKGTSPAAAAIVQQKIMLAHAVKLSPKLGMSKDKLECGYGKDGEEPVVSERVEPAKLEDCGFEGLPDPTGFYYRSQTAMDRSKE